jgi:hypothetical protein
MLLDRGHAARDLRRVNTHPQDRLFRASMCVLAAAALAACNDRGETMDPASARPTPGDTYRRAAYISVSDEHPGVGDTIIVAARVGGADSSLGIGSFKARLTHDSSLAYIGEVASPDFMRVVNPGEGQITVAGATATVTSQTLLFAVRMVVREENALERLGLQVDELTSPGFGNELPALRRVRGNHLDRSLSLLR